jgi:hypothetical protein
MLPLLAGCSGGDPTATDPAMLFEDAFLTPPDQVSILADGGTMVRGLDGWLKLQPKLSGLEARHEDEFVYRDCSQPLAWFSEATGDKRLLEENASLLCQERVDPRFNFDNGRWLVRDRTHGLVYYRIWKKFP